MRELSAGQRRRALLAAAWIGTPRVALLDEPLESLDAAMRERVLLWIADLVGRCRGRRRRPLEPFAPLATTALTVRDGRTLSLRVLPLEPGAPPRELLASAGRGEGWVGGGVRRPGSGARAAGPGRSRVASLEPRLLGHDGVAEEELREAIEGLADVGRQEVGRAAARQPHLDLGVAPQVVLEARRDDLVLGEQTHAAARPRGWPAAGADSACRRAAGRRSAAGARAVRAQYLRTK